jgi:hypothetical protein
MSHESWEQSRAWQDAQAQLLEECDLVQLEPVLGNLSVDHAIDLDAGEVDLPVGRRDALENAGMSAGEQDALRDHLRVGRSGFHLELEIREALEEDGEELGPSIGVQRDGVDAVRRVRDVVRVRASASRCSSRLLNASIH